MVGSGSGRGSAAAGYHDCGKARVGIPVLFADVGLHCLTAGMLREPRL